MEIEAVISVGAAGIFRILFLPQTVVTLCLKRTKSDDKISFVTKPELNDSMDLAGKFQPF